MLGRSAALAVALLFCPTPSYAQQELTGTYEGRWTITTRGSDFPNFGTLKITRAEEGKLIGTFTVHRYFCSGDYSIEGRYADNKLEMIPHPASTLPVRSTHSPAGGAGDFTESRKPGGPQGSPSRILGYRNWVCLVTDTE